MDGLVEFKEVVLLTCQRKGFTFPDSMVLLQDECDEEDGAAAGMNGSRSLDSGHGSWLLVRLASLCGW